MIYPYIKHHESRDFKKIQTKFLKQNQMATLMASSIFTPTLFFSSSSTTKSTIYTLSSSSSSSAILLPKDHNFHFSTLVPQLGLGPFSSWNGLKHLGISVTERTLKIGRKGRRKGKVVFASLFGVGAPEALVIGVVALLVFGPKGLAEVARNLGKTLREFQPTIRELQEVSKEFKSTLEKEIGLDEISSSIQDTNRSRPTNPTASTPASNAGIEDSKNVVDPNGVSSPNKALSSEDLLKITEERLRAGFAAQPQVQTPPPGEGQLEPQTEPQGAQEDATTAIPYDTLSPGAQEDATTAIPYDTLSPVASQEDATAGIPKSEKPKSET